MNNTLRIVVFSFLLSACRESAAPEAQVGSGTEDTIKDQQTTDDFPWTKNVSQSCDSCNWKIAEIDFVDAIPTDTFRITQPTVIEFFTLAGDQSWFDSLPDNHQTYYRMMDQYGHYTVRYRPLLESRGVKIISKPTRTVYFFEDDKHEYIVDATSYLRKDGVLMFTPGKAPVFWTATVMKPGCDDSTFVKCYFGK